MLHRTRHWQREEGRERGTEGRETQRREEEARLSWRRSWKRRKEGRKKEGRTQKVERRARMSDPNGNEIQPVSIEKERHRVPK